MLQKIISRINGFTYVQTDYDYYTGELKEVQRIAYSDGLRSKVNCYGANDVREGVAIMWKEGVDVSITGNSYKPDTFPASGCRYIQERMRRSRKEILLSCFQVVVQDVHFTRTTWQQDRLLTV